MKKVVNIVYLYRNIFLARRKDNCTTNNNFEVTSHNYMSLSLIFNLNLLAF
jgi:hypothetical protein